MFILNKSSKMILKVLSFKSKSNCSLIVYTQKCLSFAATPNRLNIQTLSLLIRGFQIPLFISSKLTAILPDRANFAQ